MSYYKIKVVQKENEKIYELSNFNEVRFKRLEGRNLLVCSCAQNSKYKKENPWCAHKEAVILHNAKEKIIEEDFTQQENENIDDVKRELDLQGSQHSPVEVNKEENDMQIDEEVSFFSEEELNEIKNSLE